MTTIEIEIALMRFLNVRTNLIVPNVSWGIYEPRARGGILHECDLIVLSKANYATEIEIKISKSDIKADRKKHHAHIHPLIARLYFAVPEKLQETALEQIPERAGLYVITSKQYSDIGKVITSNCPKLIRQCKRNTNALQWSDQQRLKLAHLGCMRILNLKKKIAHKQIGLFER